MQGSYFNSASYLIEVHKSTTKEGILMQNLLRKKDMKVAKPWDAAAAF